MLPLLRQGHLVGSLELCRRRENSMMQPRSSDRLTHFAAVAAICIENCSNRERLRIHSLIDVLTGVRNRRAFEESLLHEVARAVRTGQALTAMFVDLDHFKAVNDRFGHPCGDRVLTEIAANIGQMLRPTDLLSRYGGEEFVALLPACDQVQAQGIARRITMSVAALDFHDDNGEAFQLTCSVGFSSWLYPDSRDIDASDMARYLIARADQALYLAKQQGRNRSCHLPPDEFPDT
jgi:diguanylate cyclase (GGDEF)-like protein